MYIKILSESNPAAPALASLAHLEFTCFRESEDSQVRNQPSGISVIQGPGTYLEAMRV